MKQFPLWLVLFICCTLFSQTSTPKLNRYYKAECGTAADYLELASDGTYRIIGREHTGVSVTQRGHWEEKGGVITFEPESVLRGGKIVTKQNRPYEGTEVKYRDKDFITFKTEGAAEIVIPLSDIEHELDTDPQSVPLYVLFRTSSKAFDVETKQTYPFRYINPRVKQK